MHDGTLGRNQNAQGGDEDFDTEMPGGGSAGARQIPTTSATPTAADAIPTSSAPAPAPHTTGTRETPGTDYYFSDFRTLVEQQADLDHRFGAAMEPKRIKDGELFRNSRTVKTARRAVPAVKASAAEPAAPSAPPATQSTERQAPPPPAPPTTTDGTPSGGTSTDGTSTGGTSTSGTAPDGTSPGTPRSARTPSRAPGGGSRPPAPPLSRAGRTPLTTVPEDAPAPPPPPRVSGPATGRPDGTRLPAWVGQDLDRRRPPRIDRDLPPAPVDGGGPVRFTDGSRLPAYMGGIDSLLPGLPADVRARSYTLGQSDPELRGRDQVAAEIVGGLRGRLVPAASKNRRRTPQRSLQDDVLWALERNPRGFSGDGKRFTYRTVDGRTRVVTVRARPYGNWSRFTFGYANPVKLDTMQRYVSATGRAAVNSTSTSLVPTVPLGPAKEKFHVWGRFHFRKSWGKRAQYNMQNQVLNQAETRTTDGSHSHLGDVWYEATVTDRRGRPVDDTGKAVGPGRGRAAGFGFAVRDGVAIRLADSLTHDTRLPESLPERMDLGGRPSFRLVGTEAFGPLAHVRDWTLRQAGVKSDSVAGSQLSDFFSTDGFHRMSRTLNAGQTTTPPLFRDSAGQSPLGVFSVEVRSGDAIRISETRAAELRDIMQATVRNERVVGRSSNLDIGGAVGPAFHLFGLSQGRFDLRVLLGLNTRYGSSRSRTSTTGGTGAVKTAGQAKGDPTGVYVVQKTITVTAPPDTKAPLPDQRGDGRGRRGKLRKNPPQTWSLPPRSRTFQTWAVERMTATEARRLAGLGGPPRAAEPAAPPYLTEDDPTTLGMARPEEFTFADGAVTRLYGGRERTFAEHAAERMLDEVARVHPDLVAPLAELNPRNPRWRDADHFQIVLSNSLEVLNTLTHHSMAGNLEAMRTTGLRIALVDSGRISRGLRYVWIDGKLTGRRFEGTQQDLRLRFSAPGSENLGGQQGGGRGLHFGAEGLVSVRDSDTDTIGMPMHAGTASLGGRYGVRQDSDSSYGPSVTHEAMSIGTKGSHLYSYQLTLTARRGGFWRFRSLLRGTLFLNVLGTQPFVFAEQESPLIGPGSPGRTPVVGRVLMSIPVEHTPSRPVTPRTPSARYARPLRMPPRDARDLALATPALFRQAAGRPVPAYQKHPFLTLAVTSHPGLVKAAQETLEEASGNSWLLAQEGAPSHDAVMRAFQSQYLTANFDQSSSPLAWRVAGLWDKAPYLNRSSVVAHRTRIVPGTITALTGAVPVNTETTIGGVGAVAGRNSRTSSLFFGGQLGYLHAQDAGPGLSGTYGVAISPYRLDRSRVSVVLRNAVAEINRKDFNRQVLVTGDVQHEIAAASSTIGQRMSGRRHMWRRLAGTAGRRVLIDNGWTAHVPERSAYRLGLLTDRWSTGRDGGVPLYTRRSWSPQPWLLDNPFGSFPVNSLHTASVLADFDGKLRPLGLSKADRDTVMRLVSERVVRALGKEMVGTGSSVTAGVGRWGSQTAQFWIGSRRARARAELIPVRVPRTEAGGPGFGGLGHSVDLEEHRQAAQTVQEGRDRASGASIGTVVTEGVHTGNETVRAAGPTYSEIGSTQQNVTQYQAEGGVRIATATTTQAHGEYVTRYRLRLSLEITDTGVPDRTRDTRNTATTGNNTARTGSTARTGNSAATTAGNSATIAAAATSGNTAATGDGISKRAGRWVRKATGRRRLSIVSEGDVGDLIEHYPLSLMRPDPPAPADGEAQAADPLAPPVLAPPGTPRKVAVPRTLGEGGWHDVRHPRDGSTKPFTLPANGFKVRRIVGLDQLHTANTLALAGAYDAAIDVPRTGRPSAALMAKALDTPLTRAGTGSAQNLEDGTGNGALTSFYDDTLNPGGYQVPGLTDRGFFGGADGDLTLYSKPDFHGAQLLTVTDGMKHEAATRHLQAGGMSAARVGTTESALGGGPLTSTQDTGYNQMGASGPGDSSTDSDAFTASGDRLSSVNVKPNTTRSFLFAVPTTWLTVAAVHHHVKDSGAVRLLRSPFGGTRRAPQAVETQTAVLAWVREDVARDLGLIDDTRFPPKVSRAWDAVTKADKEWTAADKRYWDLRRGEGPRLEAALEQAQRNLAAVTTRNPENLPQIVNARAVLLHLHDEVRSADPAHDGWAELQAQQLERAESRLSDLRRAAAAEVTAAQAARDAAQNHLDVLTGRLETARTTAEELADEYVRVREGADRLTRWHQLNATVDGRMRLGTTAEPAEVVFTPPPANSETKAPAPKKGRTKKGEKQADGRKRADGRNAEGKQRADGRTRPYGKNDRGRRADGKRDGTGNGAATAGQGVRPAYARPPWEPDPAGPLVRFDAATDHRTLTATTPDGRTQVYDLHRPDVDGNGFFAAVAHSLGGRPVNHIRLAERVAHSPDLPADAALDPDAVFHMRELQTRIPFRTLRDPGLRAAVEAAGGRLTPAVREQLSPFQRHSLVKLHVQRARHWDAATAVLAASVTARTLGANLTVVEEDGSARRFSGAGPYTTEPLREATVYRQGGSYLSVLPRSLPAPPAPAAPAAPLAAPVAPAPPAPTTPPPPPPLVTSSERMTGAPAATASTTPETTGTPAMTVASAKTASTDPFAEGGRTDGRGRSFDLPENDGRDNRGRETDPPAPTVPVVHLDEAQRRWIAQQVTDGDLPADRSGLGIADPVGLYHADGPVDRLRKLMLGTDDWPQELHAVAARASTRLWDTAYTDFTNSVLDADPDTSRRDIRRTWSRAVRLITKADPDSAPADPRYAGDRYRGAVRQVADLLVASDGSWKAAGELAGRLREDLGPRPQERGDIAGPADVPPTAKEPAPVRDAGRAPVPATTKSPLRSSPPAGDVPTPEAASAQHPAAALAVTAAVPIRIPFRPYVEFTEKDKKLDEAALREIDLHAKRIVATGLRDLSAGLGVPPVTVTGHGNGPRFAIGSGAARQAERTGRLRAQAVADALRAAIGRELAASAAVRRGRDVGVDDFTIEVRSGGRTAPESGSGTAADTGGRGGARRRAVIDVEWSSRSRVLDRLERLFPRLDVIDPQPPAQSLDDVADLLMPRPTSGPGSGQHPVRPSPLGTPGPGTRSGTGAVPDRLRPLYDLVSDAMDERLDTGAAALTAFHLRRQGLFSGATLLTGADGSVEGRQWTNRSGGEIDASAYHVVQLQNFSSTARPVPWTSGPGKTRSFVVATAGGDHKAVELALPDGRQWAVSEEVFAELLAMDPALAGVDPAVPVVLVSPKAGDMGLDLPRRSSFRTGRNVWAHTGTAMLGHDPQTSRRRINVLDDRDSEAPLGTWLRSEPDDWADEESATSPHLRTVDGASVHADEIESVALPLDWRPAGRMVMGAADRRTREWGAAELLTATEWYAIDPVTEKPVGGPYPVPWRGQAYIAWMHGRPGLSDVTDTDSRSRELPGPSTARFLSRRPSLRKLPRHVPIVHLSCWSGALPSGEVVGYDSPTPFVADRLAALSVIGDLANEHERRVYGPKRSHVLWPKGSRAAYGIDTTVQGTSAGWEEARPEPKGKDLDEVARLAGLDEPGLDAGERRQAALRLVRAGREIFGASVEDDRAAYREVLRGLGAVEVMRRQDLDYAGGGVFTLDLLERVVWARTGQSSAAGPVSPRPLDPGEVRATLRAARRALDADGQAGLSKFVALPAVDRAREVLPASGDPDERARQVLGIAAGERVTPADRRALLWAVIRAVEAVDGHPDAAALTRRVLHLPAGADPRDPAYRDALLWTAVGAAAIGRDVHSPTALAAFDLQRQGALDDSTRVVSTGDVVVGRNWSPRAVPGRLETGRYTVVDPTGRRQASEHPTPWTEGPSRGEPYVVVLGPGAEPDTVAMPWPDGTTRSVPYEEIAELIRHDPVMRRRTSVSKVRVVPVGLGTADRKLRDLLTSRDFAGRVTIEARRPLELRDDPAQGITSLELASPSSDRYTDWGSSSPKALALPPTNPADTSSATAPTAGDPPAVPGIRSAVPAIRSAVPAIRSAVPVPSAVTAAPWAQQPSATGPADPELTLRQVTDRDDWLPRALAEALRIYALGRLHRPGLGALLARPDAGEAFHRWVESRLAQPGAGRYAPHLASDTWAGPGRRLTTAELDALRVPVTGEQRGYAGLAGGLSPGEVTLSLAQRYRLLRQWDDSRVTVTETGAALAASDLGLRIAITGPGGVVRHFAPSGPPDQRRPDHDPCALLPPSGRPRAAAAPSAAPVAATASARDHTASHRLPQRSR
ncbi:lonely Cys domain-containing protein [Streptomyces sp. NPDC006012]|uniref:lonely Cys domain-containing protein n=1 Tax=Streptomyces sp. NPDC006012 TaxID=3364739 RepID=UPI00368BD20B